jgi:hypothetical protein
MSQIKKQSKDTTASESRELICAKTVQTLKYKDS